MYLVVLLFLHLQLVLAQNRSCYVYNNNGGELNITETQTTPQEIVHDRRLSLYCYADNFCQIEWFREGIPMNGYKNLWNFPSDYQEQWMHLPPTDDNNQTLKFDKFTCDAEGRWTCAVSGEENQLNRTMEIIVTGVPYEGTPLCPLHDNCVDTKKEFGEEVTLFCPCTAGEATSEVKIEWFKWVEESGADEEEDDGDEHGQWVPVSELGQNGTTYTLSQPQFTLYSYCEYSDEPSTVGQYLTINSLSEKEVGDYRVVATRMDEGIYKGLNKSEIVNVSRKIPQAPILSNTIAIVMAVCFAVVLVIAVAMSILWYFRRTDIKLFIKDRYGMLESGDGKTIDAYIAYSESDSDLNFVLHTLMPALQKAGYVPFVKDIDAIPGETLVEQLLTALTNSRRCILVISPDFLQARHTALQLEVATDQMLRHQSKIIPLLFKSVNAEDLKKVRGLKRILAVLKELRWDDGENAKNEGIFKKLLLRMPRVDPDKLQLPADMPLSSRLLGGLYGNSTSFLDGSQSLNSSQQSLVPEVRCATVGKTIPNNTCRHGGNDEERSVAVGETIPNNTGDHSANDNKVVGVSLHATVPTRTDATIA
ncbi:interleukin-1 receptor accessory protein-like isoform X2 [Amphiura filiformis]|uniref:interleukin-1 receptor accessory protein-like isoform X2 n=1 Tax=Amphiura filiformis TaxID=82378 RepID=UPI003B227407